MYIRIINIYLTPNFLRENYFKNLQATLKNRHNICKYYSNVYMIISQDQ